MKLVFGGTRKVRGVKSDEIPKLSFTPVTTTTTITGTPTTVIVKDTIHTKTEGSFEAKTIVQIALTNLSTNPDISDVVIENLSPTIAILNQDSLYLDPLGYGGDVNLKVSNKLTTLKLSTNVSRDAYSSSYSEFADFEIGSLRKHIKDQVLGVIAGKTGWNPYNEFGVQAPVPINSQWFDPMQPINSTTPTRHQLVYYTNDNITYTRSPLHILNGIDITGINNQYYDKAHNTSGNAATLISPRHILSAIHHHPIVGSRLQWVDSSNNVYTRTVISEWKDFERNTDQWIGLLDSDLPSSIKPLKVLPSNYLTYLPPLPLQTGGIPAYAIFASSGMITLGVYNDSSPYNSSVNIGSSGIFSKVNSSIVMGKPQYYDSITSFQWNGLFGSGTPVFTVINNEAVLLFSIWWGGYAGTNVHNNLTALNAGMHSLSAAAGLTSDYQLTPVDLTGFNTY